jgi:hypothetical protein
LIPSREDVGSGFTSPEHIGVIGANVGVNQFVTVTVAIVVFAHFQSVGVKV